MEVYRFELLSPRVGVITDRAKHNGWFQLAYLGFTSKALATDFLRWLSKTAPSKRVELRTAKRLRGVKYELKIEDLDPVILHRCLTKDRARFPNTPEDDAALDRLCS